jgi:tetratricopeptide (TPR) repeat protein
VSIHATLSARNLAGILVSIILSLAVQGQMQSTPTSAAIQGRVTNAQGHAVSARVEVNTPDGQGHLSMQSDSNGNYRFAAVAVGAYSLRAEAAGYESATVGPFTIATGDIKRIDLTLQPKGAQQSSLGNPEFFDQPQFTIAGVTDTTNLGGHASGAMGPSTESLAKDIAALGGRESMSPSDAAVERTARAAAEHEPDNFEANYRAGNLLLKQGKSREAIPYLERANRVKPNDYASSYVLAEGYTRAGEYENAGTLIRGLQSTHDNADLHHLLGEVEEKSGHPLKAVKEYQRAAKMDPSETNLFDWGTELLTHRAIEPAMEVFSNGHRRFPQSARMLTGLGVASYDRGSYEEALRYLCAAADLNPADPNPYLLLGKMQNADNGQSDLRLTRLERFAHLQPENPWANYYYALALWKRRKGAGAEDTTTSAQVESLLHNAVHLDPKMAPGYLQLGILYSERKDLPQAISSFQTAIQIDPQLEQAHYRLAQAYMAAGHSPEGQAEIERYKQISKTKADETEKERREIRQFVYTMPDGPPAQKPQ